jgi:hypothetical protein
MSLSQASVFLTRPCEQTAVTDLARRLGRRSPQRAFSITHAVPLANPVIAVVGYKISPDPHNKRFKIAVLTLLHGEEADPAIVVAVADAAIRSIEAFGYDTFVADSVLPAASVRTLKQRGWRVDEDPLTPASVWRRQAVAPANDRMLPAAGPIMQTPPVTHPACNARG